MNLTSKNPHAKPQGSTLMFLSYGQKYVSSVLVCSMTLTLTFVLIFKNLKHIILRYAGLPAQNKKSSDQQFPRNGP